MTMAMFKFTSLKEVTKLTPGTLLEKPQLVSTFPFLSWNTKFHCHVHNSCQRLIHLMCASVSFIVGLCVN
jgi:hypothetical protein